MLQRFSSLFQRQISPKLEEELAALESQAQGAARDYRATILARAAERCVDADEGGRALAYFGRAIDCYLEFGYYDVAANLCRRVIELYPQVVRARCTLAFLSLAEGLPHQPFHDALADARREIGGYVQAARAAGRDGIAIERLHLMAESTDNPDVREVIAEFLLELGDVGGADEVFGTVYAERNDIGVPRLEEQRERWAEALRTAVVTVDQRGRVMAEDPALR
jgi:tetratricopeptide (TPR) repeat protein